MRRTPPPIGVGMTCLVDQPATWAEVRDHLDFVEVTPDVLCRERLRGASREMRYVPSLLAAAMDRAEGLPIVVHGVELSIGSVDGWNSSYLDILDQMWDARPFAWHSEHLGFLLAPGAAADEEIYVGAPMPLPFTDEALDLVAPRAAALVERYPVPFLLENGVHYFTDLPSERGRDGIDFMNELCARSGCDLLLDLFNLYCDAQNQGFDALEAVSRLDLDRVVEIHVAGGVLHDGFLLDAHSDAVPEPVWELLDFVVPRAPRLGGIVFEMLPSMVEAFGGPAIIRQLERARASWESRPREAASRGSA